ncbi:beta-N-acetylhexosaminidase [Clostridium thermosuccinogenes]|uniref:Beta-N-acetylhexosaminidase n=1 Tax=Clostridium thermosuccinogenes TaxID=84032 RepID=A0A2K2FQS8_9CLOT|nr:family 20 glycosylhydrolase [Pseudoclostridium thermosuccinogenes]AUS96058.1 beta-N-acetylhexosaminidase [Pseudoclostridium thermosuccinogenes]PNT99446.1 beta-N-acetylhexosaminidase [Pseudoclostridium thermosuccinogenes]PNU01133.1 beta-N-acetylhexosaminidase [Pseudoclostridium thermosuccinogenes]
MSDIRPQYIKIKGNGKYVTGNTEIRCSIPIVKEMFKQASVGACCSKAEFSKISFMSDIPKNIEEEVTKEFNLSFVDNEEAFVIDIDGDINIYSRSDRGLFYGCITLLQMMKDQYLDRMLAFDYPSCPERGVKVYLPSERNIEYFKQFVDMICYFKYNTIMIEVGGAMEYKRHPEINSGWIEYCKEMSEYSGKTTKIQDHTYKWYKNSIHVENGEGSFLSQSRVRELVEYCRERMLEVIPEVPSLSHCDYLLLNHREIAERQNDPYPDTYCPSNPKSYALLFDILDEVIEVFKPSVINIGHDEYYSIGICENCKDRKAEDIFAEDIRKIHDYLSKRGIRTMIWGDKLLKDVYVKDAGPFGGAEIKMYHPAWHINDGEYVGMIPATYKAIDLIPADVKILHWNWGLGEKLEDQFLERGMEITYGNFEGYEFPGWSEHIQKGIKGAIISNWSTLNEIILQRNGILFGIAYAYFMFWNDKYNDSMFQEVRDRVLSELFNYKYGNILDLDMTEDRKEQVEFIEFLHATDYNVAYKSFVDGVFTESDIYTIGQYVIRYDDGTKAVVPIVYGENISSRDVSWDRKRSEFEPVYKIDRHLAEVSMTTLPVKMGEDTYYRFICRNPYPKKRIDTISIECDESKKCNIYLKSIKYL